MKKNKVENVIFKKALMSDIKEIAINYSVDCNDEESWNYEKGFYETTQNWEWMKYKDLPVHLLERYDYYENEKLVCLECYHDEEFNNSGEYVSDDRTLHDILIALDSPCTKVNGTTCKISFVDGKTHTCNDAENFEKLLKIMFREILKNSTMKFDREFVTFYQKKQIVGDLTIKDDHYKPVFDLLTKKQQKKIMRYRYL